MIRLWIDSHLKTGAPRKSLQRLATRLFVCAAVLICNAALARGPSPVDAVSLAALPREARAVHAQVRKGGPFAYPKDASTFGNHEGILPRKKRGYYREYTVETPGARNRGARRIICGAEAAEWAKNAPATCYYTDNHYASFRAIRE